MTKPTPDPTILIVDDDPEMLFAISTYLDMLAYNPITASSAEEALEIVQNQNVDAIISDVEMPGQSGIDLLRHIRQIKPTMPMIIQTGRPRVDAAVECVKLGANDYLQKPVDPALLATKISDLLNAQDAIDVLDRNVRTIRPDHSGRVLGGYAIDHVLGEGNVGVVFLARRPGDDSAQEYALKILKLSQLHKAEQESFRDRFAHEAMAAERIDHPNIVKIIEWGISSEEQIPYMVMEYVKGQSLRAEIASDRQRTHKEKSDILQQLASAIAAIHSQKITHRDIKPDNVIITPDNRVKLTDFGIARLPESNLTLTTTLLGTPNYLSPEGFESAKIDGRSDLFSFGVLAYEFLVGKRPFTAPSIAALAHAVRCTAPVEPRRHVPDFPRELQAILAGLLKKSVRQRYQSAAQVVADLQEYLEGRGAALGERLQKQESGKDWSP